MGNHQRIAAWLNGIFSVLCLATLALFSLLAIGMFGVVSQTSADTQTGWVLSWLGGATIVLVAVIAAFCAAGLVGAYGLLHDKRFGTPLLVAASAVNFFIVPIGTVLGIYTLWALFFDKEASQAPASLDTHM